MTCYELYKMMFYGLDDQYDLNKNEKLGKFLSAMNPFLFKGEGSADPSIYEKFKVEYESNFSKECTIEEGYYFAKEWLKKQNNVELNNAFEKITIEEWIEAANKMK
jgi:hypothetical protein